MQKGRRYDATDEGIRGARSAHHTMVSLLQRFVAGTYVCCGLLAPLTCQICEGINFSHRRACPCGGMAHGRRYRGGLFCRGRPWGAADAAPWHPVCGMRVRAEVSCLSPALHRKSLLHKKGGFCTKSRQIFLLTSLDYFNKKYHTT